MRELVREAFLAARDDEQSPDVVIADPELNARFLQACQDRGLAALPVALNLCLYNLRKSSALRGIRSKRVPMRGQEEYRFASEIAVRFLGRRDQVSLDQILCDPVRAAQFDEIAAQIAPGFSPFHYRRAALNLRKARKLRPELLARVAPPERVVIGKITDLRLAEVPRQPGLYLFIRPGGVLYVGECQDLQKRISKHLDHSDNKGLARWLWEHGTGELHLEYQVLPKGTSTRVRKALEAELIHSREPLFNVAGVEPKK
jgi:hypothetical protein